MLCGVEAFEKNVEEEISTQKIKVVGSQILLELVFSCRGIASAAW